MSLAMYASPFDDDSNSNNQSDFINQKRQQQQQQQHNKTLKKPIKESFNNNKVNSVLNKIHNRDSDEEEDEEEYFSSPPNKPHSVSLDKTVARENMTTQFGVNNIKTLGNAPQPNNIGRDELELNYFDQATDTKNTEDYYKKILPSYLQQNIMNKPTSPVQPQSNGGNDILLQKINYMIHLLEENTDEKTNNVTEEVVLYSFLGIFVIFIVDSFARVVIHTKHDGCYDRPIYEDKAERLRYVTIRINPPKIFMFHEREQAINFFKEYIQDLDVPDHRCKKDDDIEHVPNCACGLRDDNEYTTLFYNKRNQVFLLEHSSDVFLPPQKVKKQIDALNFTNGLIRKAKILEQEYVSRKKELNQVCEECSCLDSDNDEPPTNANANTSANTSANAKQSV